MLWYQNGMIFQHIEFKSELSNLSCASRSNYWNYKLII